MMVKNIPIEMTNPEFIRVDIMPDAIPRSAGGTEFMMLREGRVHFEGSPHALATSRDPYLREFLS